MAATQPRVAHLTIRAPLRRAELPALFARTCRLLGERHPTLLVCEVHGIEADAVAVDALARLGLAARRHRCGVTFAGASCELRELIELVGLGDALPCAEG
jgi:ABC-type transporter Mla MlaB component